MTASTVGTPNTYSAPPTPSVPDDQRSLLLFVMNELRRLVTLSRKDAANIITAKLTLTTVPPAYANDAAAAAGGVIVGGTYRTGSALMVRVV